MLNLESSSVSSAVSFLEATRFDSAVDASFFFCSSSTVHFERSSFRLATCRLSSAASSVRERIGCNKLGVPSIVGCSTCNVLRMMWYSSLNMERDVESFDTSARNLITSSCDDPSLF